MSNNSAYLKNAKPSLIEAAVKSYGAVAFLGGGLSDIDIATCAASAISALSTKTTNLATFFISSVSSDSSYRYIRYTIDDNSMTNMVWIKKVIMRQIHNMPLRDKKIEEGMLYPREQAKELVSMLNRLQCERDGTDVYQVAAECAGWSIFNGELPDPQDESKTIEIPIFNHTVYGEGITGESYDHEYDTTKSEADNWKALCERHNIDV